MLAAKAIFRATHAFHAISSSISLGQGLSVNEELIQKVKSVMESVLGRREEDGVKLYHGQWAHRIFSVDTAPNIIFKMVPDNNSEVEKRFKNMVTAETVCRTHDLGLLVIPRAQKIEIQHNDRRYTVLAEEKIDINPESSAQEQHYAEYASSLNEAIRQLALFICKTKFSDVEWRNNPIVDNSLDANGNRKIALIDLEEMRSLEDGLFGSCLRRGLVECVNEEQGAIVVEEARRHISIPESAKSAQDRRKVELEDDRKRSEYYRAHDIATGAEQLVVVEEELDFSEYPKSEKLKKLAIDLIAEINRQTRESSEQQSIKGRRNIHINTNHELFFGTDRWNPDTSINPNDYESDEDYYNATYLGIVTRKLDELNYIYKLKERNGHGYFIQA